MGAAGLHDAAGSRILVWFRQVGDTDPELCSRLRQDSDAELQAIPARFMSVGQFSGKGLVIQFV